MDAKKTFIDYLALTKYECIHCMYSDCGSNGIVEQRMLMRYFAARIYNEDLG